MFYGWKKDKYNPEAELHKTVSVAKLPPVVDMSAYLPSVRDQGGQSSCVGHGIAGIVTATFIQQFGIHAYEWFSPQWVWNGARYIEGTLAQNDGVQPTDGFSWITKQGNLQEHFWPYSPVNLDKTAPSSLREKEAIKYKGWKVTRVADGVNGIMSALAAGHFVAIGTPWFVNWMNPGANGVLPVVNSSSDVDGGHGYFLYGYSLGLGVNIFFAQNSWGPDWAKGGRFFVPMSAIDVFKQLGGYDAHYVNFKLK